MVKRPVNTIRPVVTLITVSAAQGTRERRKIMVTIKYNVIDKSDLLSLIEDSAKTKKPVKRCIG